MKEQYDEREEFLSLVRAARDQLEFYKEIGLTHLGGYNRSHESPPEAVEDMPKKKQTAEPASLEQGSLFDIGEPAPVARSQPSAPQKLPQKPDETLEEIRTEVGSCSDLCKHCTNVVFGEGNPKAGLMFVGEAPGADEDATGRPFVGAAGRLLDKIIEAIGMKREDVYITNVVKCRPPNNRKPTTEEIESCEPFLFREIDVIKPKMIVTLGATPMFSLLRVKDGITKIRGNFYSFRGIPVMPTFHPAFLLRVPERKREVWEDMKKVVGKLQEMKERD
jgi:uracil-DNA glycosylase